MNVLTGEILLRVLVLVAICSLLFMLPFLLVGAGIRKKNRWFIVAGAAWLLLSCGLVRFVSDRFSARHECILDHGKTPDGREYVLFQVCTGEPFSVELFVRNTKGEWQFYYVDHEVWPWRRGGRLDFSDGKARVFCGDEPFLDIDIDEDGGSESCRYPAAMTAEGVFSCCRYK